MARGLQWYWFKEIRAPFAHHTLLRTEVGFLRGSFLSFSQGDLGNGY